jgi:CRP-like cAMP-binding protein
LNNLENLLAKAEVFSEFTPAERNELVRLSVEKRYGLGNIVHLQGDHWPIVVYVFSGELEVVISSIDSRMYTGAVWEKGDVLWGHTIFDGDSMPATLQARRISVVYQWNGEDVLNMVLQNKKAIRALLRQQTTLLRKRRNMIIDLVFNPVASRLANYLLESADYTEGVPAKRYLTLDEMASRLVASPEYLCRMLYRLQSDGLIEIDREYITICNKKSLESISAAVSEGEQEALS